MGTRVPSRVQALSDERINRMVAKQGPSRAGYRAIMSEIRPGDFYDPWGVALGWLFAIADLTYVDTGEILPDYQPGAFMPTRASLDMEDWTTEFLATGIDNGTLTWEDLHTAYAILSRYADWCKLAGWSY